MLSSRLKVTSIETLNTILTWYIGLSISWSMIAAAFWIIVAIIFKKEEKPLRYILMERLAIILPLAIIAAFLGFAVGMIIMFLLESHGYPNVSYELYGGLGSATGMVTGVTLGWLYGFWPLIRSKPVRQNGRSSADMK